MAYCVDECVDVFGTWVENELEKIKRGKKESETSYNAKKQKRLLELVSPTPKKKEDAKAYAAPVVKSWKGGKTSG